jgi:hypothetical protein
MQLTVTRVPALLAPGQAIAAEFCLQRCKKALRFANRLRQANVKIHGNQILIEFSDKLYACTLLATLDVKSVDNQQLSNVIRLLQHVSHCQLALPRS